jgi:CheY-specific phosphatase CheX
MSRHDLSSLLAPAVAEVLETMFFSESLGPCQPDPGGLTAKVDFAGEFSGTVAVRISEASARSLAASFLGESEDSLTDTHVAQVVCELTNMLCGCIVSKVAAHGCFDLSAPELRCETRADASDPVHIQQSFAIDRGTITVSLASCESA